MHNDEISKLTKDEKKDIDKVTDIFDVIVNVSKKYIENLLLFILLDNNKNAISLKLNKSIDTKLNIGVLSGLIDIKENPIDVIAITNNIIEWYTVIKKSIKYYCKIEMPTYEKRINIDLPDLIRFIIENVLILDKFDTTTTLSYNELSDILKDDKTLYGYSYATFDRSEFYNIDYSNDIKMNKTELTELTDVLLEHVKIAGIFSKYSMMAATSRLPNAITYESIDGYMVLLYKILVNYLTTHSDFPQNFFILNIFDHNSMRRHNGITKIGQIYLSRIIGVYLLSVSFYEGLISNNGKVDELLWNKIYYRLETYNSFIDDLITTLVKSGDDVFKTVVIRPGQHGMFLDDIHSVIFDIVHTHTNK